MKNNIKRILVIFPMIFLLLMTFIGINAKAEVKVDKQNNITTTSNQGTESNNLTSTEVIFKFYKKLKRAQQLLVQFKIKTSGSSSSMIKIQKQHVIETLPVWKSINGKLYYVTKDGIVKKTGWFKEKDENPNANNDYEYYLDENYAATIGWTKIHRLMVLF